MKISKLISNKETWKRRVTPEQGGKMSSTLNSFYSYRDNNTLNLPSPYQELTQDDFLNEVSPDSHKINETYYSQRPVWRLETDESGKQNWIIDGYDEVEAISLGLQKCFIRKYLARFTGNGVWIANETENDKLFEKFNSWRDTAGFNVGFKEFANSAFNTADAAIYQYVDENNQIQFKVFSYLYGDVLFPQIDEDGDEIIVRLYSLMGKNCVEIYSPKYIECWIQFDPENEKDKSWMQRAKGYLKRTIGLDVVSEDGWRRLYRKSTQISGNINQCVYVRLDDIPTGCVQSSIEALERACSYVAENVRGSAFPMLFLAATKFTTLPPMGASPTIGVQGTAEDIKAARAEYIAPANMSDIAKLNIDQLWSNITKTANIVFVNPEVLKSGTDSSTTIKIMFAPEVEWAMEMWIQFFKPVKQMIEVFKQLVGKVEGNISEYASLRLSCGIEPYIPQNMAEEINNVVSKTNARLMSRKAGISELDDKYIGDYEKAWQEWEKEIRIKSEIPAQVTAKYNPVDTSTGEKNLASNTNKSANPVDKRDSGRSIQDR